MIHVTIVYRITIHRQNYYYFGAERYIEHDATNLKVKPNSGTASIHFLKKTSGDWRLVRIDYSRLYDGHSRQFTISYDLPAGVPRSTAERRAGYAWADFCAAGFGGDEGEVRVVMPAGIRRRPDAVHAVDGEGRLDRDVDVGPPEVETMAVLCLLEGSETDGLSVDRRRRRIRATVQGWIGDKAWKAAVVPTVTDDLPKLSRRCSARVRRPAADRP